MARWKFVSATSCTIKWHDRMEVSYFSWSWDDFEMIIAEKVVADPYSPPCTHFSI